MTSPSRKSRTVVSNSSPLIRLSQIGRLSLLREFFGELLIPPAVYREVVVEGRGRPGSREVREASWIKVVGIKDERLKRILQFMLDEGRAEVMVLALEINASLLLIDDREACLQAKRLRLGVTTRRDYLGMIMSNYWTTPALYCFVSRRDDRWFSTAVTLASFLLAVTKCLQFV